MSSCTGRRPTLPLHGRAESRSTRSAASRRQRQRSSRAFRDCGCSTEEQSRGGPTANQPPSSEPPVAGAFAMWESSSTSRAISRCARHSGGLSSSCWRRAEAHVCQRLRVPRTSRCSLGTAARSRRRAPRSGCRTVAGDAMAARARRGDADRRARAPASPKPRRMNVFVRLRLVRMILAAAVALRAVSWGVAAGFTLIAGTAVSRPRNAAPGARAGRASGIGRRGVALRGRRCCLAGPRRVVAPARGALGRGMLPGSRVCARDGGRDRARRACRSGARRSHGWRRRARAPRARCGCLSRSPWSAC